jgi:arsenite methyltransferase
MTEYLSRQFDLSDARLVSAYDELPLWSAMAGLLLLEHVPLRPNVRALDVGCGTGFPLLDLSQRLGPGSFVIGLDPWKAALDRANEKARPLGIANVQTVASDAAAMPFEDAQFDLIVSNLGVNNFDDPAGVLAECFRVAKPGATIALTSNLRGHMKEFYEVFAETLSEMNLADALMRLRAHIDHRTTILATEKLLGEAGFAQIRHVSRDHVLRYANGSALLRHPFIRLGFLDGWKKVAPTDGQASFFARLEENLNRVAAENGELRLTVPFAYFEAKKSS